jgi:hypothetical protein
MRCSAIYLALSIAIFPITVVGQVTPGFAPSGAPYHAPAPNDGTLVRQQAKQGVDAMMTPLKISFGKKSQDWNAEKLATLPHQTMQIPDPKSRAQQTYSGVPLIALLMEVGVPEKLKGRDLRLYLVAEGKDGKKVVYSLGEVSPDEHDGEVLLVDSVDGKPLADNRPIALISSSARRDSRWIQDVVSIRVQSAE